MAMQTEDHWNEEKVDYRKILGYPKESDLKESIGLRYTDQFTIINDFLSVGPYDTGKYLVIDSHLCGLHPKIEELLVEGVELFNQSYFDAALENFTEVSERNEFCAVAQYCKGRAYYSIENQPQALRCYERALTIDQLFAEAHGGKCIVLSLSEKINENTALQYCQRGLQIKPRFIYGIKHLLHHYLNKLSMSEWEKSKNPTSTKELIRFKQEQEHLKTKLETSYALSQEHNLDLKIILKKRYKEFQKRLQI